MTKAKPAGRQSLQFLYPARGIGGVERFLVTLARGLPADEFEVGVICYEDQSGDPSWFSEQLDSVVASPNFKPYDQPKSFMDVLRFSLEMRRARPNVVFLHSGANYINWRDALSCLLSSARRRFVMVRLLRHALEGGTL